VTWKSPVICPRARVLLERIALKLGLWKNTFCHCRVGLIAPPQSSSRRPGFLLSGRPFPCESAKGP